MVVQSLAEFYTLLRCKFEHKWELVETLFLQGQNRYPYSNQRVGSEFWKFQKDTRSWIRYLSLKGSWTNIFKSN